MSNPYRGDDDGQRDEEILAAWMPRTSSADLTPSYGSSLEHQQQVRVEAYRERARKYRPTLPKKIAAWISLGLGTFFVMSAFMTPVEGTTRVQHIGMALCIAVFFGLPGAYWHFCNWRDQPKIRRWVSANAQYKEVLGTFSASDRQLFAEPEEFPAIPQRYWLAIWLLVVASVFVFGVISPDVPAA